MNNIEIHEKSTKQEYIITRNPIVLDKDRKHAIELCLQRNLPFILITRGGLLFQKEQDVTYNELNELRRIGTKLLCIGSEMNLFGYEGDEVIALSRKYYDHALIGLKEYWKTK